MDDKNNTHTGVSVVDVAGCCNDCGRDSSDWVLTKPLPWPLTVSPLVTGGCCWVKAAFNLWNANTNLKKMLPAFYPNLTPNTLLVNQMRHVNEYINFKLSSDLLYSTALLNISKTDKRTFGKLSWVTLGNFSSLLSLEIA